MTRLEQATQAVTDMFNGPFGLKASVEDAAVRAAMAVELFWNAGDGIRYCRDSERAATIQPTLDLLDIYWQEAGEWDDTMTAAALAAFGLLPMDAADIREFLTDGYEAELIRRVEVVLGD